MEKKETINIIRDYEAKKRLKVEKRLQTFFTDMVRIIGVVFLLAFAVMGAFFYYQTQASTNNITVNLLMSTAVVIFLSLMTQVEDRW